MRISDWSSDMCSSDLPRRQRLPQLDCRRPDFLECPCVVRLARLTRAQARDAAEALDLCRGIAVLLDPAQCPVPRQHAAPFEQIGRASCRDRVCQYVSISVVAGSLKKKHRNTKK